MKTTQTIVLETLDQIDFTPDQVVVADAALPTSIIDSLQDPILVEAGENLKSLHNIEKVAEMILERRSEKPLTIVAVGGGSIGDAIGFIASTLWRGVGLIHLPTTLLAMVDSAHGGKTAVNLGPLKNQLGSFYPADKVFIVKEIIDALPFHLRTEGLAEIVKCAWLDSPAFVEQLRGIDWHDSDQLLQVIQQTIAFKNRVVEQDPFDDKDVRIQLNLGHTAAHGLERVANLSHGESVAWGLAASALLMDSRTFREPLIEDALRLIRPTAAVRTLPKAEFCAAVDRDKKKKDGKLRSLFVEKPGSFLIDDKTSAEDWYGAVLQAHKRVDGSANLETTEPKRARITLPPAKSELIRALLIDPETPLVSPCDDVFFTNSALRALSRGERIIEIGEGAAPFRFCAVRAAFTIEGSVEFRLGPTLNNRSHDALVQALNRNGIESSHDKTRSTFTIQCRVLPKADYAAEFEKTSQIASGFLLLRAVGVETEVAYDETSVSGSYVDMTERMLNGEDGVEADAGAYAFWMILSDLGFEIEISNPPVSGRQSDAAIKEVLAAAKKTGKVSLKTCPDLGPVLAAWAAISKTELRVSDASHLRNKESDRLGGLVTALKSVGAQIEETDDGFVVSSTGLASEGREFPTFHDHRMAMAAAVIATAKPISIDDAGCVSKSYPSFWRDVERVGIRLSYTDDL